MSADALSDGFTAPPDSAKPHTWWHWMNGNVTKEGITADSEAMKRVDFGDARKTSDWDWDASKDFLREHRDDPAFARFHQLAYGLRPEEELYFVVADAFQLNNLAADPRHARVKKVLRADLDSWIKRVGDPRSGTLERGDIFDRYPPRLAMPKAPIL